MLFITGGDQMKTLSEVVKIVGMSRRVIQEYEKAGLSKTPSETNKYGHLLYDDKTIERLRQIRFYRDMGYDKKRMKAFFENNKDFDSREAIMSRIELMEREKERLEALIGEARGLTELGLSPSAMHSSLPKAEDLPYDTLSAIIDRVCIDNDDDGFVNVFTEEDGDKLLEIAEKAAKCLESGLPCESSEMQSCVRELHRTLSKALLGSVFTLSWVSLCLCPDTELSAEIDDALGNGYSAYLFSAIRHYCKNEPDTPTDRSLKTTLKAIEAYRKKSYAPDSEEVTNEVGKLYDIFNTINVIPRDKRPKLFHNFGRLMGDKKFSEKFDSDDDRKTAEFFSKAVCGYCERIL